ncbi:LysR family transcriptional regulator [Paracoccus sp. MBLB3053]|uniref:LysR family transcriptional regulator n=1 Tax=Paracoccus aurantius TaxID=3073814 RepID=A0ABU2HYW3_9RHOB|nr:LysR family transcriptional regulator [Paracoccus sp. MBLB3053]MDS9470226.1 LysR family transcriptional regulator [Paracoccus sp. MBLB3053]
MDTGILEDFVVLCSELNFSAAASRRNMTQPAFSRRIMALESWIGTPLFQRTSRSVTLTAAGRALLPRAGAMLRDLRQAKEEALEIAGKSAKSLIIASTHALSFTFVPHWMIQKLDHASFGSVSLISDSYAECEALLLRGGTSFLVCHAHPTATTRLSSRHVLSTRIGRDCLIPLSKPAEDGSPLWRVTRDPASQPTPYLAYAPQSGIGRILEADWQEHDRRPHLKAIFHSHLAATLREVAKEGQGVAWVPLSLAATDVASGSLVRAGDADYEVPVEVRLFRPASRLSRQAELFWEIASGQKEADV